jgi:hypothetical protein
MHHSYYLIPHELNLPFCKGNYCSSMHTLDHTELEQELQVEQALAEEHANPVPDPGKSRCIPPIYLDFYVSINIYITV